MPDRSEQSGELDRPPIKKGKSAPTLPLDILARSKPSGARSAPPPAQAPAIIVAILVCAIFGLTLWYLVQPQPLLVQGEADATRIDIAARVEGKVASRPVSRGDNVAAGAVLYEIGNPE